MKISAQIPFFQQIEAAIKSNIPLCIDARLERGGDKICYLTTAQWINKLYDVPITILESSPGKTSFMLSDYELPEGITAEERDPFASIPEMDIRIHAHPDAVWILNPFLSQIGIHPELKLKRQLARTNEVVFCMLQGTEYNERRDMDFQSARNTIDYLRLNGHEVTVICDIDHPLLPDRAPLSMNEIIIRLATAKCVIAGDTGFGHIASAFETPVVNLYWDTFLSGVAKFDLSVQVSEWYGINAYNIAKSFLVNAPLDRLRVVIVGTDHRWSLDHVLRSVNEISLKAEERKEVENVRSNIIMAR